MEQAMPSSFSSEGGGISVVETLEGGPSWSLSLERLAVSESSFFVGSACREHKTLCISWTGQSRLHILIFFIFFFSFWVQFFFWYLYTCNWDFLIVGWNNPGIPLTQLWLVLRDSPGLVVWPSLGDDGNWLSTSWTNLEKQASWLTVFHWTESL